MVGYNKRLIRGIALGYLIKNYSDSFRRSVTIEKIKRSGSKKNCFLVEMFKNEFFGILIDLDEKKIHHLNCYSKNRGYDSAKIIDFNIEKFGNIDECLSRKNS